MGGENISKAARVAAAQAVLDEFEGKWGAASGR